MARRWRKRAPAAPDRDIHDARRVAETMGFPALRARLRKHLPRGGDRGIRRRLSGGCDAGSLHPLQRTGEVQGPSGHAKELDADCMATGHYIQRKDAVQGPELHQAADPNRDQSYFLFSTTPEQLSYLRFPLGHLASKAETRALARATACRWPTSPTARTSASSRMATMPP
jgi:tRNA-specific 2-thiouridylase